MTKIAQQDVQCSDCHNVTECNFYVSANVTIDPSLKDKIIDESLFWKTCQTCGSDFDVRHDLLYHDMEKQFCVWLKYENELGEIELERGAQRADKVFKNYRLRIAFVRTELIEKIKLAEDGYDDIFIETVKLFHSIKNQIDVVSPFYYDRTENRRGKRQLVFIHSPTGSAAIEYALDLENAEEAVGPIIPQIAGALTSEWAPWMWVSRGTILDAFEACGLGRRRGTVARVHVLYPSGYQLEEWAIEDDEEAERFRDKATGDLYAISFFTDGEPTTEFVLRQQWEEARRRLDEI
jgi:CpXC motif protein